ncbi:MAG: methyl-accepting chemotaxis protein [Pseudomonadota bacterium]|nr:methyl-accepting chemotaxis protein [Pseudomonadota bacterium]MDQ3228765.1 methyl-accepting chemotaxis protein [Pseudomonadota bacterium]
MSTVMDAVAGKSRNLGTNFWLLLLVGSIAVLGANTAYSTYKAARLGGASTSAADLQVLSQQLAVQGREAVEGDAAAFTAFKATKAAIEEDVATLRDRYGDEGTVSGSINNVAQRWTALGSSADQVIASEKAVLDLAGNAKRFTDAVPQLQAQLDEVVRAMSASGSPSSQVYIALREVVLASTMAQRIAQIQAGGATASLAGQSLRRDAQVFDQVMTGLRQGGSGNAQRVTAPAAVAALNQANTQWVAMKKDLDAILGSSQNLFRAQSSAAAITAGSNAMLTDSKELFSDFTSFGSMTDTSLLGNIWVSILAGIGMILGLAGLLFSLYRAQERRRATVEELNNRNQEAIMRLLDEMGSLAEGDLTVKATVTEDMTGAIADSINFAVEQLRSLVQTITDTSVQVASSAQETQATAMQLAEAAEHQAQEINTASDRISEIAASIDQVSKNSAESAEVAQRSVQIATNGAGVVRQTIAGMDSIRDQIQETSKRIKRLGESSQEIGSIVELINDISEQTNILALNAAIQAASAGEAGRGFAVVADEVQRLAERASNATKRIETLVQTIQSDTNEAVSSMEQTTAEVVSGARLAEDAGTALGEIERVSTDLSNLIQGISSASQQQSSAASNITQTMNTIQQITLQTSQGANQTAESIGNLAQLAADLRRSVADFKLPA